MDKSRLLSRLMVACLIAALLATLASRAVIGQPLTQASTVAPPPPVPDERTQTLTPSPTNAALPICKVVGDSLGFGLSVFSSAGDWIIDTHTQQGVDWRFGYFYVGHLSHPIGDDALWFLNYRLDQIESSGAIPVVTFYAMLKIGEEKYSGSEAQIVQQMLQDPALMRDYLDNYVDLVSMLNARATAEAPIILQVEPDSWGFMMWAMGVEGNNDATTVPVKVATSGHPDVQSFADHAAGLGQALVHLRDLHGPNLLLGWHASNFRVGTRPDVVADFFGSMGAWDVLFTEPPHMLPQTASWWDAWDAALVSTNLDWYTTISSDTGLPFLIWQDVFGNDYHLIGEWASDKTMLTQLASAGVIGYMFEHQNRCGDSDPDDFRDQGCSLAPGEQPGGRARHYRERVLAYQTSPLMWPESSPCGAGALSHPFGLHVFSAEATSTTLTATLRWTPPSDALSQTLRYAAMVITPANWDMVEILSATLAGDATTYTLTLPYADGTTYYFALKAQDSQGTWSELSNNALWPYHRLYLPCIQR